MARINGGVFPITDPNADVFLTVTFGNAQLGTATILLNGAVVGVGQSFINVKLGTGATLKGKRLSIGGLIPDTNPNSNYTNMTVTVTGGGSGSQDFSTDETVANHGDSSDQFSRVDFQ